MIENEITVSVSLEVVKASEIEPKEVKWLWYPYIPFSKGTLLQCNPGDGKSKFMLSFAALLSKGEPLPFTEAEENDLILSSIRQRKMTRRYGSTLIKFCWWQRSKPYLHQGR